MSDKSLDITITDAGFAALIEQKSFSDIAVRDKVWMAPELENIIQNPKTDVWSIGAITYWLLTG